MEGEGRFDLGRVVKGGHLAEFVGDRGNKPATSVIGVAACSAGLVDNGEGASKSIVGCVGNRTPGVGELSDAAPGVALESRDAAHRASHGRATLAIVSDTDRVSGGIDLCEHAAGGVVSLCCRGVAQRQHFARQQRTGSGVSVTSEIGESIGDRRQHPGRIAIADDTSRVIRHAIEQLRRVVGEGE